MVKSKLIGGPDDGAELAIGPSVTTVGSQNPDAKGVYRRIDDSCKFEWVVDEHPEDDRKLLQTIEWVQVTPETLPEDDTVVLAWTFAWNESRRCYIEDGIWYFDDFRINDPSPQCASNPTHYCKMPDPRDGKWVDSP